MITNEELDHKTNIERAMERAREEGARRDAAAIAAQRANTLHFSTEDEETIAAQYASGVNTADFTYHGQIGINAKGESIIGETRVYIINEEPVAPTHNASQEKDMNTTNQSAVAAAAEAAAAGQVAEEAAFDAELNTLIDEGMVVGQQMIDNLDTTMAGVEGLSSPENQAPADASSKQSEEPVKEAAGNTLHQEPTKEAPKQEPKKFGFKSFFKGVGQKATALKDKVVKPAPKVELDQAAMLEEIKGLLATAVKQVEDGMSKLPKGMFIPAPLVATSDDGVVTVVGPAPAM